MKRLIYLATCTAFALQVQAFGAVELVRNGRPVSEIVLASDALQVVKLAAQDLQKHLELMSGARLPIVSAPTTKVNNRVYVGESRFTKELGFQATKFNHSGLEILVKDEYVILVGVDIQREPSPYRMTVDDVRYLNGETPRPNSYPSPGLKQWQEFTGHKFTTQHLDDHLGSLNGPLGIHSNDDTGTWYAVAELLEQLGVRWYMPYEDGTVIPETPTITVVEQHLRKESHFARREWCFYGAMRGDAEGIAWLKRLKAGNRSTILYNHTTYAIYSSREQQELHPEYLACDAEGKPYSGYPSGRGMPRYANPAFRAAAATYMNKVFDAFPDLSALTIGPPDGGVTMDARDVTQYGEPGDSIVQKASNYVWDFHVYLAGELKRTHPDKRLIYMTGAGANLVPTNIEEFPDNLIVPLPGYSPAQRVLATTERDLISRREAWHAKMQTIRPAPVWNYFLWYRTPNHPRYPVFFTESLQREMQEILPYCDGKFIEIQPVRITNQDGRETMRLNTPGLIHLMVYLQNKLFWAPNLDRQALLDEYYTLFFGPAAAEMKAFHEFAEQVWIRQESRSVTPTTGFLREPDVTRFFEILALARAKAGDGTVYARRIALMEREMETLKTFFPNLARTGPQIRAYLAPAKATIDGNLDKYQHGWVALRDNLTGDTPAKNAASAVIAVTPDRSALVVGVRCHENRMAKLKADCQSNDDSSIFNDDVVEVYVNTPQRSYFKIVVNPNGMIWDESTDVSVIERDTLPLLWNPGVKAAIRKHVDHWTAEIWIPTKDFGEMGPSETFPWGIQIGRTRFTGGGCDTWAIAPTSGKPYATTNRWANLWMR